MNNFLQGSTQIKQQKNSKSKIGFELPRIAKGDFNEQSGPIALRFHWLTLPKDYSVVSNLQIQAQYTQLRRELILLNDQAVKNVERISIKSVKKSKKTIDSSKVGELNDRQSENNAAIIARLRMQLQQLQKRIVSIEQTGKDSIQSQIQETKEQINYLRHKNKDIQLKSKNIGSHIENGDQIFAEVKKLEIDLNIADRKKAKLELRSKEVSQNLQKVKKNLNELNGEAQQAQTFIEQNIELSRVDKQQKKLEFIYRQRTYNLQIVKKNDQSFQNLKQQRYHQSLKQLEDLTAKIKQLDISINSAEEKHLNQKGELIDYQQRLKMAIQSQKERRNNSVLEEPNNFHQKENTQMKKSTIENLRKNNTLVSKIKRNESAQKNSQQLPKKMRLLNIKLEKQVNKQIDNDKMNHTISAISKKDITKKETTNKQFDQSNLSYQQQKTNTKINTIDYPQAKKKTSEKQYDQFNQPENIQQDISSLDKEQNQEIVLQLQHNQKQNGSNPFIKQTVESSIPIASEKSITKKSLYEEQDQDIVDFRKSIEAQLNTPFTGLKNVDIALGQIQQTIRQQQTKSRLNKFKQQKPIQQEQESIGE